jgi:hypothetical protein
LPPVLLTPAVPVAKFDGGVIETGGNFATSAVDIGGKFSAGFVDIGGKFSASVIDTGVVLSLANNDPYVFLEAWEMMIHEKTCSKKSCDTVHLYNFFAGKLWIKWRRKKEVRIFSQ